MADRTLTVKIVGDSRQLERAFNRSTRAVDTFGARTTRAIGSFTKGLAFGGAIAGVGALAAAVRAGTEEFSDQQKVAAQTNAVLKSTGGVANVTAKQVERLSESLSQQSGIDDELIARGENLLLTFKNVRNEVGKGNDVFNRATRAAIDLSVAGFGSVETTSKQLGKALNDPIRGMSALARAGVTFTDSQRDQIKAMVEANNVLGAQRLILREVETQVGGSAKALGQTLPGQVNRLRETFNNFAGDLVAEFAPAISKTVERLTKWFSSTENQARVQRDLTTVVNTARSVVQAFLEVVRAVTPPIRAVNSALGGTTNTVKLLIAALAISKLRAFGAALGVMGTSAAGSTVKVNALRASLLRLGAIGLVVIPIEIVLNRDKIDKAVTNFLKKHHLSALGVGEQIDLPAGLSKKALQKMRDDLAKLKGESDLTVKAIDKAIATRGTSGTIQPKSVAASSPLGSRTSTVVVQAPDVYIDGNKVSTVTRRNDTIHARANPKQRRGRRR